MKQHINLLHALPQTEVLRFPAIQMLFWFGVIFFILVIFAGYQQVRVMLMQQNFNRVQAEELAAAQKFDVIVQQYPEIARNEPLEKQMLALAREVESKNDLVNVLSRKHQDEGFSPYLNSLAQSIPNGVWLQHIMIDLVKDELSLEGFSNQPERIAEFMHRLRENKTFNDLKFDELAMQHDTSVTEEYGHNVVNFTLGKTDAE